MGCGWHRLELWNRINDLQALVPFQLLKRFFSCTSINAFNSNCIALRAQYFKSVTTYNNPLVEILCFCLAIRVKDQIVKIVDLNSSFCFLANIYILELLCCLCFWFNEIHQVLSMNLDLHFAQVTKKFFLEVIGLLFNFSIKCLNILLSRTTFGNEIHTIFNKLDCMFN